MLAIRLPRNNARNLLPPPLSLPCRTFAPIVPTARTFFFFLVQMLVLREQLHVITRSRQQYLPWRALNSPPKRHFISLGPWQVIDAYCCSEWGPHANQRGDELPYLGRSSDKGEGKSSAAEAAAAAAAAADVTGVFTRSTCAAAAGSRRRHGSRPLRRISRLRSGLHAGFWFPWRRGGKEGVLATWETIYGKRHVFPKSRKSVILVSRRG